MEDLGRHEKSMILDLLKDFGGGVPLEFILVQIFARLNLAKISVIF